MRTLGRLLWLGITLVLVMFAIVFATSNKTLVTLPLGAMANDSGKAVAH
jgi:hypothetical protein